MPLAKLETILVVDDAPLNIAMIAGLLKDKFKIKVATHGEKAIALANGVEPPDLILLDIMMPEMVMKFAVVLRQIPKQLKSPSSFSPPRVIR